MVLSMNMPESLQKFISNYNKLHPMKCDDTTAHFNNVYHIQSIDRDGNVTNECFGKNLITDWAMQNYVGSFTKDSNISWKLLIGTGTGTIDRSSTSMLQLPSAGCISTNSTLWHSASKAEFKECMTPTEYDSTTGISTMYLSLGDKGEAYVFDYNMTGVTEDLTITEIGLGRNPSTSNHNLITHSKVYDIDGNETSFVKRVNEKLNVTAYMGIAVNIANIMSALESNHIPGVVTPMAFLQLIFNIGYCGMTLLERKNNPYTTVKYECPRLCNAGGSGNDYQCTATYNTSTGVLSVDSRVTRKKFIENGEWYSRYVVTNGFGKPNSWTDWTWYSYSSMMLSIGPKAGFKLATPEAFTQTIMTNANNNTFNTVLFYTNSSGTTMPVRQGYAGRLPLSQLDVSSMKMYDYTQHDWVSESYLQDNTLDYNTTFCWTHWTWFYCKYNDTVYDRYVWVNDRTEFPITSFNTTAQIWATNTFWDPSTWEVVTPANVEASLSKKKYYITTTTDFPSPNWDRSGSAGTMLTLRLDTNVPEFTVPNNGIIMAEDTYSRYVYPIPSKNCIVSPNALVYFDSTDPSDTSAIVAYPITNVGNNVVTNTRSMYLNSTDSGSLAMFKLTEAGDKLVMSMFSRSASNLKNNFRSGVYRVWTISSDKNTAPTSTDINVGFTTDDVTTPTIHTFSDQGYVVATHNSDNEIKIIDVYAAAGSEVSTVSGNWGYALNKTSYMVYQDITGVGDTTFVIYDMSTATEVKRFSLDKAYTVNCVAGWGDNVYVRVYDETLSTYSVLHYNITDETIVDVTDASADVFGTTEYNYFNSDWIQCGRDHSACSCDEVFIMPTGEYKSYNDGNLATLCCRLVLDKDPNNFRTLYPTSFDDYGDTRTIPSANQRTTGNFMKNSDGSFFALETSIASEANRSPRTTYTTTDWVVKYLDIGNLYDNDEVDDIYGTNLGVGAPWTTYGVIYKDWLISKSDASNLIFRPIERFRIHKIEATTESIQTINNPKEFVMNNVITVSISN